MMQGGFLFHSSRQSFATLLALCLGVALLLSPYQLHANPSSIFFKADASTSHQHDHHHQAAKDIRCLRCVLYGFQTPDVIVTFIIIFVVLGFLIPPKPREPLSFVTLDKTARSPPAFS